MNVLSICLHSTLADMASGPIDPVLVGANTFISLTYSSEDRLSALSGPFSDRWVSSESRISNVFGSVPEFKLESSAALFADVVKHPSSEALPIVALLNEAAVAYKEYNFALATVAAWSICERLQSMAWRKYYEEKGVVSRARREFLEGRDFSASVISTVLELAEVLTSEIRGDLDAARKARNKWLHSGEEPTSEGARACVDAAIAMIDSLLGLRLMVRNDLGIFF